MTEQPTKKIENCPYCGSPCKEGTLYRELFVVACERGFIHEIGSVLSMCSYRGPVAFSADMALFAHNKVAERYNRSRKASGG